MLGWALKELEKTRVAWSYIGHERDERRRHLAIAGDRFPTSDLEQEIADLSRTLASEVALRHDPIGAPLLEGAEHDRQTLRSLRRQIAVLERDYKSELDELHARIGSTKAMLDHLYADKDEIHEEIETTKASIDHWYRMSDCYLGNRGRKIPKSRLFGRSQDDLDHYKVRKASALQALDSCRQEIDEAKAIKAGLVRDLAELMASRQEMRDMRARGVSVESLQVAIVQATSSLRAGEARIRDFQVERARFEAERRADLGIPERGEELKRMRSAREAFVKSFDSLAAIRQRKEEHLSVWRAKHVRPTS